MLERRAAQRPQGVLQPLGQGHEAFAAQDDVGVLEARVGQAEVVQAVLERDARDSDAEIRHVGEVGQPGAARLVGLAEDDVLLGPVHGAPGADAALQGPADTVPEFGVSLADLREHGDRAQAGRGLQHGHHLGLEHVGERIPGAGVRGGPHAWRAGAGPW